jgi:predicted acylesterase/phospholipase RssA
MGVGDRSESPAVSVLKRAEDVLQGRFETPEYVLELVRELHKHRYFGVARKLLERLAGSTDVALRPQQRVLVAQKLALSTYKDPDLPADARLERALDVLRRVDDLAATRDQETLGLAGAIYKRMWELFGVERDLETSCAYYLRGHRVGVRTDYGYNGVNAAFVLDLLADLEAPDQSLGQQSETGRHELALQIRREILDVLTPLCDVRGNEELHLRQQWWFLVTLGEAAFGVGEYDTAAGWLLQAAALPHRSDWEIESTARQLAALANLNERRAARRAAKPDVRATEVLGMFLRALGTVSNVEAALASVVRGKVGLALSGGGFRAALYHVGVLARLAELDLLRHVEYLSCVSGGSIVGALYYLEVRRVLLEKPDAEITRADYLDLVERVRVALVGGVQRNIRTRIAAEWLTNVKMIFAPNYSRTKRAGELYEREIYARVADGEGSKPRYLNDLKIIPHGERPDFRPKDHNWRRAAKVPILVLNATSLNTGHNWQFTASWMGEPPAAVDSEVDANYRLRRMYYEQAPPPHDRVRLGYAVAASACVPGIFEPLPLANLYERTPTETDRKVRPIVRLVDGGVYDNQGTAALLEQGCSVLLVSDASGQMDHQDNPSDGLLGVPLRANSILQARVRVSQYEELESRRRAGILKGLMFVHLKKDLPSPPVDWIGCQDPSAPLPPRTVTSYGVQKSIQRRLAAIRTDLDSFTDVEADALMSSGYLATETALKTPVLGFDVPAPDCRQWLFLRIAPLLSASSATSPLALWLDRQLKFGSKLAFKIWWQARWLQIVALLVLVAVAASLVSVVWGEVTIDVRAVLLSVFWAVVGFAGYGVVGKVFNYRKTLREIFIGLGMATVGFVFARLHLHVFDRLFLNKGRLPAVLRQSRELALSERAKAAEERASAVESMKEAKAGRGYAVQRSQGFVLYATKLADASTQAKISQTIDQLSDDGGSADSKRDAETGLQLVRVEGTPWRIAFDVDEETRRVRIHHLIETTSKSGRL